MVDYSRKTSTLEEIRNEATHAQQSGQDVHGGPQLRLRHAELQASTYEQAYEAAKMDAERLCPGETFTLATGRDPIGKLDRQTNHRAELKETMRQELTEMRAWMTQLPDEAKRAREQAEHMARNRQRWL